MSVERVAALPLFPLQSVLFPGGQLALKIFEARYLDLISDCLRSRQPFGVVCLLQGGELRRIVACVLFEPRHHIEAAIALEDLTGRGTTNASRQRLADVRRAQQAEPGGGRRHPSRRRGGPVGRDSA